MLIVSFSCCLQTKVLHCNRKEGSGASVSIMHLTPFFKDAGDTGLVAVAGKDVHKIEIFNYSCS